MHKRHRRNSREDPTWPLIGMVLGFLFVSSLGSSGCRGCHGPVFACDSVDLGSGCGWDARFDFVNETDATSSMTPTYCGGNCCPPDFQAFSIDGGMKIAVIAQGDTWAETYWSIKTFWDVTQGNGCLLEMLSSFQSVQQAPSPCVALPTGTCVQTLDLVRHLDADYGDPVPSLDAPISLIGSQLYLSDSIDPGFPLGQLCSGCRSDTLGDLLDPSTGILPNNHQAVFLLWSEDSRGDIQLLGIVSSADPLSPDLTGSYLLSGIWLWGNYP